MPPAGGVRTPVALLQYVGRHPGHGSTAFAELVNRQEALEAGADRVRGKVEPLEEAFAALLEGDRTLEVSAARARMTRAVTPCLPAVAPPGAKAGVLSPEP